MAPSQRIALLGLGVCLAAACRHPAGPEHAAAGAVSERGAIGAVAGSARASSVAFATVAATVDRFCLDCHGRGEKKGGVSLDGFAAAGIAAADAETWKLVLERLRDGDMPPAKKPQPTAAQKQELAAFIETEVWAGICRAPDPGPKVVRRLNRVEYENTVRDLLGVAVPLADDFPSDGSAYGFDNVGEALSLSPTLIEKYLRAADRALDAALAPAARATPRVTRSRADALEVSYLAKKTADGWVWLNSHEEDSVETMIDVPFASVWAVRFHGYATVDPTRAVYLDGGPDKYALRLDHVPPVLATWMVDGAPVRDFEVTATRAAPGTYEWRGELPPGRRRVAIAVRRLKDGMTTLHATARWRWGPDQWGVLALDQVEVEGPLPPVGARAAAASARSTDVVSSPSRLGGALLAAHAGGGESERVAAARDVLRPFALRAFRRPPAPDELEGLLDVARAAWRRGADFQGGVRDALKAVLVAPAFLLRDEDPAPVSGPRPLDEFGLASRLSYWLWSSMPDDRLLARAEAGALRRELAAEVARMLRDPRSDAFVRDFAGQWLQLRELDRVSIAEKHFPQVKDGSLRGLLRTETELFFEHVLRQDRGVLDFLDADYTFVNDLLAHHYGIDGVVGPEFRKVSLAGLPRRGVLTHGSVLMLTSNPTRTSPVKRGKWVLETLLGAPPPPPPPNVPALPEGKHVTGTVRERMAQHRENPVCASCHDRMDPLGLGLENFDAVGRFREEDGGEPVDASGKLQTGETFAGPVELARILAANKREAFVRALIEKLLTYALGRGLRPDDRCAVDRIYDRAARSGFRFSSLIGGVIESVPFQNVGPGGAGALALGGATPENKGGR